MARMTPTSGRQPARWRRWLRDVLLACAAVVLLTATGALPEAAESVGLVPAAQLPATVNGHLSP
jgi:hypothetical protein